MRDSSQSGNLGVNKERSVYIAYTFLRTFVVFCYLDLWTFVFGANSRLLGWLRNNRMSFWVPRIANWVIYGEDFVLNDYYRVLPSREVNWHSAVTDRSFISRVTFTLGTEILFKSLYTGRVSVLFRIDSFHSYYVMQWSNNTDCQWDLFLVKKQNLETHSESLIIVYFFF